MAGSGRRRIYMSKSVAGGALERSVGRLRNYSTSRDGCQGADDGGRCRVGRDTVAEWRRVWRQAGRSAEHSVLNLSRFRLTSLPAEIGRLTGLTKRYVHNNQLASLPVQRV